MPGIDDFFGSKLNPPPGAENYAAGDITGLQFFLSNILKVAIYGAGIFGLINLFISAIQYLGSSGNPELIKQATGRIWMSILGLVIVAGALILAGIAGLVMFGNLYAIIKPVIPGP
jgi:hypothetical protein